MKKLLLFIPILLSVFFVKAQFGLQKIITSSITSNPQEVKSFDLNGDGDLDLLSASYDDAKIAWYENLGGGTFGVQQIISVSAFKTESIYAADLNGDGDLDVICTTQNEVVWFENLGGGSFGLPQIIVSGGNRYTSVYAEDMDGDGDLDVLSASYYNNQVEWYENQGSGIYGPMQIIGSITGPLVVSASDLDGDGDIDVLCGGSNQIQWGENLGGGSFLWQWQYVVSNNVSDVYSISAVDIDGDGDLDILSSSVGADKIEWFENLGGGSFGIEQLISNTVEYATSAYASDLDSDGDVDVISSSSYNNEIYWHENLGGGIFGNQQVITNLVDGPSFVYADDLDGDGDMDVLTVSSIDDKIAWYENLGIATFGPQQNITPSPTSGASSIYSADLDGDGDIDILSVSRDDDKIALYENFGGGIFGVQQIIDTSSGGQFSVYTADIDNDGDLDIVSGCQNKVVWYENLGALTFGSPQNIASTDINSANSIYTADMDGDGDVDILSASRFTGKVYLHPNLGGGAFGGQYIIGNLIFPSSVHAADIDSDGDYDVLFTEMTNNVLGWYENLGSLNFSGHSISTNLNPNSVYATDLDGDGDLDVLCGSVGKIVWHENLGNGSFAPQQIITTNANNTQSVYAADLNNDGNIDVLSASSDDDKIAWYKNLGNGSFGPQQIITTNAIGASSVYTTDLDNDGDIDVLSASMYDDKIAWYENFYGSPFKLSGNVFYDVNQNQLKDTNEFGLSFVPVSLTPNDAYSFSNSGYYSFSSDSGTYTVNQNFSNPLWDLTTDSTSYTKTLTGANPIADSLDFGFYPNTIQTIITPKLIGGFPRCDQIVNYWVNIRNEGTTLPNGVVHLQLDDSISYVSSATAPDSIVGQHIYWHYDSLFFFAEKSFNIQVQMPPFTSMGDTLTSILNVYELDGANTIIYTNTDTLNQVSVCAYDPNDKTVLPKGIGTQGYIANEQKLEYLIRFQNTGNDTALTVMVRDQLDENLDWSSLHPIASSHPVQIWIEQDGEAVFKFENIMLPDSNVDFLGSQGFIKFSINPKSTLAPNTPIFNTGHIYFDNNPAVITNTVLNTIEDTTSLPVSVQEITFTETNEIIVFPNPFTEHITIYYKANINRTYHVSLYDMSGREIMKKENNTNNKTELDVSQLKNGIYILVGTDNTGKKLFSERIVAQ